MNILKNLSRRNKIIIAILGPVILFFYAWVIAYLIDNDFEFERTWGIWFTYILLVGIFLSLLYLRKIKEWIDKLTEIQRVITSISIPLILFFIFYPFMGVVSRTYEFYGGYSYGNPFKFADTWYLWLIYILIISFILYKLWDKKK